MGWKSLVTVLSVCSTISWDFTSVGCFAMPLYPLGSSNFDNLMPWYFQYWGGDVRWFSIFLFLGRSYKWTWTERRIYNTNHSVHNVTAYSLHALYMRHEYVSADNKGLVHPKECMTDYYPHDSGDPRAGLWGFCEYRYRPKYDLVAMAEFPVHSDAAVCPFGLPNNCWINWVDAQNSWDSPYHYTIVHVIPWISISSS